MIFWLALTLILIGMAVIAVLNTLTFPRLRPAAPPTGSRVSVLVPARNEAGQIAETVRLILAQDHPNFELIVLDDHSTDATTSEALRAAGGDPRFRLLDGKLLPPGWLGKNWACHQLSEAARGEVLVFTDADVRWQPGALNAALASLERTRADLLTIWPVQIAETWSERLVTPLLAFSVLAYLPELAVRYIPWTVFAAANGQCLVFRRAAYQRIGGHAALRGSVLDDMSLAWNVKRARLRLAGALSGGFVQTRMYAGWNALRAGFAKNILAGHGNKPALLLVSTVFHWLLFVIPWLWLALGWLWADPNSLWPWMPAAMTALGLSLRLLTAAASGQRLSDALLMPASVVLMTLISGQALAWRRSGAATWKGRSIPLE